MSEPTKNRSVYRLPPCPAYDQEALESWLTDLAAEGLYLKKEGFFAGVASFERDIPRPVRYRLEAAPGSTSMWAHNWGEPSPEAIAISEAYGWEYVDKYGEFHIYRTFDPAARELHTDPAIQAMTVKKVRNRQYDSLARVLLWCILYPFAYLRGALLALELAFGFWCFLLTVLLLTAALVDSIQRLFYFTRLRRRLLSGETIHRRKDWKKKAKGWHIERFTTVAAVLLWIAMLLNVFASHQLGSREIPLADYTGTVPFSTVADLGPDKEGEYKLVNILGIANTVETWRDPLFPVNIRWEEIAEISYSDGTKLDGSLYVDYHEARHPLLARELAREFRQSDKRGTYFFNTSKRYQDLPLPDLGVDFACAYRNNYGFYTVVLQQENTVMHITYVQHSVTHDAYHLDIEEWAAIFVDDLKQQ